MNLFCLDQQDLLKIFEKVDAYTIIFVIFSLVTMSCDPGHIHSNGITSVSVLRHQEQANNYFLKSQMTTTNQWSSATLTSNDHKKETLDCHRSRWIFWTDTNQPLWRNLFVSTFWISTLTTTTTTTSFLL